ncbi:MAG: response regulator transcription factor [Flavobacteriales bacterium]|nr:response regulator transcription factor [Flavobacteriales bacterium]
MNATCLLLVEDDTTLGQLLQDYLKLKNFEVVWFTTASGALEWLQGHRPHLCLLDVMLPDLDGFELCRRIKSILPQLPVVFLTARSLLDDQKTGFRLGGEDYIVKPFDSELLLLKINAILQRIPEIGANKSNRSLLVFGQCRLDTELRELSSPGGLFQLSPRETHLLAYLARRLNQVCRRSDVLREVWGEQSLRAARSMDVFITRLRKYLASDKSLSISNVHNEGYILREFASPLPQIEIPSKTKLPGQP